MEGNSSEHATITPPTHWKRVDWPHPPQKQWRPARRLTQSNVLGAHNDEELKEIFRNAGSRTVIVDYGAAWCEHCKQMIPPFLKISEEYDSATSPLFVLADVDRVPHTSADIRYTPTFAFYVRGRKVDEIFGSNVQKLRDHIWMHSAKA